MIRLQRTLLLLALFSVANLSAFAYPNFLEDYKADKYHSIKDPGCNTCHMSPAGGDERNPFGKAFEAGGETITPMLRAQFPGERFTYPMMKVSDTMTIHFSDPDNKVVVVESNGQRVVVDVLKKTVDGKDAPVGGAIAALIQAGQSAPAAAGLAKNIVGSAAKKEDISIDPYAREGAFFGQNVVDLPNGKPQKKGGMEFYIGHRFPEPVFQHSAADFFGFDSVATVSFGFKYGVTDRLSVSASRTNSFRTVELSSSFQVSRQGGGVPVTLQVRGGVEGRNNFHNRGTNPFADVFRPSLQVAAVRTFYDRLSFEAVPTFAFNTRDEASFVPADLRFGADHNNTFSMGLGMGLRVLKSTSLVAEYTPRVWGFKGEIKDRPEVGFGIQKSTFRHTFQLVFSNIQPMMPTRYAVNGSDTFGIGFNIYRKLR